MERRNLKQRWAIEIETRPEWERPDFSLEEFSDRHERVREEMVHRDIDTLVVFNPGNLNYLVGFRGKSYQDFQCLLFPRDEEPLTFIVRYSDVAELERGTLADEVVGYVGLEGVRSASVASNGARRSYAGRDAEDGLQAFRRVVRDARYATGRVGIEAPQYYLSPSDHQAVLAAVGDRAVDATDLVARTRLIKSRAEIELIKRAARITDAAMDATRAAIAVGRSEFEIVGETLRGLLANGSDAPSSPPNFVSGPRSCYAHGGPTERRLEDGDFMHLEFGSSYHRYPCSIGRDFSIGAPSARARELHDIQVAACDAVIAAAKPGASTYEPHEAARRVFADAGVEHGFVHTAGYGLGPGFPPVWGLEPLHFGPGPDVELKPGMVFTVEPPLLLAEEQLGARVIDNIVITEGGCEMLSRCSREIAEIGGE
jgi:Xaa-Pro dipeptidase